MKSIIKVLLTVLYVALLAQITVSLPINNYEIPISGQTFAVLTAAFFLSRPLAVISMLLYLGLGILGLPVFAEASSGWSVITGGSGGFLIGFVAAAYFAAFAAEKGWGASIGKALSAMTIGTLIIMLFGIAQLSYQFDFPKALEWGFYPFIPGAIVKIILGALLVYYIGQIIENQKDTALNG